MEGLAYLSTDPRVKEVLADDAAFLSRLFALVPRKQTRRKGGWESPEPLPADHPLWSLDNAHISMHLSGRAQSKMFQRSGERFLDTLGKYLRGEPVAPVFDPRLGY